MIPYPPRDKTCTATTNCHCITDSGIDSMKIIGDHEEPDGSLVDLSPWRGCRESRRDELEAQSGKSGCIDQQGYVQ